VANYTDEVKAKVLVQLKVNDDNVKRTALETGVPRTTVQRWKTEWNRDGVPDHLWDLGQTHAKGFVEQAKSLRTLAMAELQTQLEAGEVKPAQLVATIGMLTDKVNLAEGFATSRTEVKTQLALPTPEDTAKFVQDSLGLMREREGVIDGTSREPAPKALPPSKE
jgi:transposase-like protein